MKISTGKGTISLPVLLAIWSVSAVTSLPGLAVSPILGDLNTIFPSASDLEIQMLTSLPSLLIIPFVLLSGKLSVGRDKLRILVVGLVIFLLSGHRLPVHPQHHGADPRQLHPRHRSRYDHPAFDRTRRRLLHRRVPRPAVGIQLLDQQSDARTRHGAFGLSRQHRLASLISGLHTAGRFARPLAVPASAAFDARTGRQRPDAQQNDRSPEARPTHGALLFHHLRRTDDHLLRRVSGRRISSAQSLFGCADFALLPRNHGSGTDSRPHHRNLQRLYERRRHCHDRRQGCSASEFSGTAGCWSSERRWRDSATD